MGFHSLHHSFVSICAAAGVPLAVVQALCGHGRPAIQRAYLHMGERTTRVAVNVLCNVLEATPAPAPVALLAAPATDAAAVSADGSASLPVATAAAVDSAATPGAAPREREALLAKIQARLAAEKRPSALGRDLQAILAADASHEPAEQLAVAAAKPPASARLYPAALGRDAGATG